MTGTGHGGPLGPGSELDDFVIEGIAGRGGMGVVYRARQRQPERVVALKVIAADLASDPQFRVRFERESSIAAQIEHPNVIPVHAVGEAGGVLYIAMRFIDGIDMRTLLAESGRLEPRRAAAIVDQVAQALDAAHAHGLVHRDVKPANILIAAAGGREHIYLTDFGLARHVEGSQALTGTGAFLGTVDYVPPEQVRGDRVDARSDVYSLGCVLFQALTGTVPYPLDSELAKLYAHDSRPPPSVLERAPDVPAAFEQVLQRAMAKNPDERYLSAGDLGRAALAASEATSLSRTERSVATGSAAPLEARPVPGRPAGDATSRPTAATEVPPRSPGPRRTRLAGLLAALVAAVVAVILLAGGGSPSKMRSRSTGGTASSPAAAGLVLGQSIGPARLGEPRKQIAAALASQGYKEKPGSSPQERNYTSGDAIYVVGFYDHGKATYIQKYNDPSITVDGVSVDSTLRTALARLPTWRRVRCARVTLLINPDHHTYFELPLGPDAHNDGSSGIIVSSFAVPFEHSACG